MSALDDRSVDGPCVVGGHVVARGQRADLELPVARLATGAGASLPVTVFHGHEPGPRVWLSAAIHGDELCGIEIIRQVIEGIDPRRLRGTVVAVPVVNVFGLIGDSRYLPDRRDLNRSFPGSPRGSLASRLAQLFMAEVVTAGSVGLDLHTAAEGRTNLPQIRGDLDDPTVLELARVFGPSVAIHARTRDGSLREAGTRAGATVLLYEAGEARRFDPVAIDRGVDGVRRVLAHLGMVDGPVPPPTSATEVARRSTWVRARRGGLASMEVALGDRVDKGSLLAVVRDAAGTYASKVRSPVAGRVIGASTHPLVYQGDALVHLTEGG